MSRLIFTEVLFGQLHKCIIHRMVFLPMEHFIFVQNLLKQPFPQLHRLQLSYGLGAFFVRAAHWSRPIAQRNDQLEI